MFSYSGFKEILVDIDSKIRLNVADLFTWWKLLLDWVIGKSCSFLGEIHVSNYIKKQFKRFVEYCKTGVIADTNLNSTLLLCPHISTEIQPICRNTLT